MNYFVIVVVACFLLVSAPCGAVAEVFRYECKLTGHAGGKLELDFRDDMDAPTKVRLIDGGKIVASIELSSSEYQLNMVKGDVTCKGDKIDIFSQAPFSAAETRLLLKHEKGKLVVEKVTFENPSEQTVEEATRMLRSGKIRQALKLLNGEIQYRYSYIQPPLAKEALRLAHESALKSYKAGDVKAAIELLDEALNLYEEIVDIDEKKSSADQRLIAAENDYGFFLYAGKRFEDAREVLSRVVQMDPGRTVAHLNYADCLWELGDRNGALKEYRLYVKAVPTGKWPRRVRERCRNCIKPTVVP